MASSRKRTGDLAWIQDILRASLGYMGPCLKRAEEKLKTRKRRYRLSMTVLAKGTQEAQAGHLCEPKASPVYI